ncbi:MAG: hypothetical protein Ct9H300mP32_5330 [Verrucomicrobiota bacterium]|nr:MAG: hypothetical protein Ct9H300mP32_5330 [Verrucomicrobiota bacterium]
MALVYEANIQHLMDRFDAVPLQPKRALAVKTSPPEKPRLTRSWPAADGVVDVADIATAV